jgi:anthranilate phosphoribosyltransferase
MKAVIGPRKELGMRTIFNVLGPLTNPAGADAQVVGVYDEALVPVLADALSQMAVERALVVHGAGLDEIGVHGESTVAEVDGGDVTEYMVTPDDLGVGTYDLSAVGGGSPTENAADMRGILEGDVDGAKRDIILANAGAAIYVSGEADSLEAGVDAARESIDSGAAAAQLDSLREFEP